MGVAGQERGIYRLTENVAEKFAELPEAGMGYQFIELSKERTSPGFFVLFDAEIAVDSTKLYKYETLRLLVGLEEPELLEGLEPFPGEEIDDLVLSENTAAFSDIAQGMIRPMWQHHFSGGLHGSPPFSDQTNTKMTFVRYSAYGRDRRVTSDGVTPGTYVTTQRDSREVPGGLAAVNRYSLPNPRPAVYRFDIEVPAGVSFLYGSVMPAFGRSGGGVEIEF